MISDEQCERLCRCARASRTDSYGLILQGVILTIGEAAMRPGEIFALHHSDVDYYTAGLIHVRRQLDLASGVTGWPKDDEPRTIAMTPKLLWKAVCQVSSTGCPRLGGHPGRSRGRRAWRMRDARSGCYARIGYRRTGFRRESPLSTDRA